MFFALTGAFFLRLIGKRSSPAVSAAKAPATAGSFFCTLGAFFFLVARGCSCNSSFLGLGKGLSCLSIRSCTTGASCCCFSLTATGKIDVSAKPGEEAAADITGIQSGSLAAAQAPPTAQANKMTTVISKLAQLNKSRGKTAANKIAQPAQNNTILQESCHCGNLLLNKATKEAMSSTTNEIMRKKATSTTAIIKWIFLFAYSTQSVNFLSFFKKKKDLYLPILAQHPYKLKLHAQK